MDVTFEVYKSEFMFRPGNTRNNEEVRGHVVFGVVVTANPVVSFDNEGNSYKRFTPWKSGCQALSLLLLIKKKSLSMKSS